MWLIDLHLSKKFHEILFIGKIFNESAQLYFTYAYAYFVSNITYPMACQYLKVSYLKFDINPQKGIKRKYVEFILR